LNSEHTMPPHAFVFSDKLGRRARDTVSDRAVSHDVSSSRGFGSTPHMPEWKKYSSYLVFQCGAIHFRNCFFRKTFKVHACATRTEI